MQELNHIITYVGDAMSDWLLIPLLIVAATWFTWRTGAVQFSMIKSMCRQLLAREDKPGISSFQAFMVSIASRVGTGNLAGVATAISAGGPGAVFWMWMIALAGAASAFVESTLAQIFKEPDGNGGFRGGPAYYIKNGIGSRLWAGTFAVLISITFGFAYNSVQSNTISEAFSTAWGLPQEAVAGVVAILTLIIIWGGIRSIAKFSQWVVPIMAILYIALALTVIALNITAVPDVLTLIIKDALGLDQAIGGTMGAAVSYGIRRGLFSNEAGEGSAPNVAATANVSHPVKQGLVQSLGVFTDTLLICSCTAFIILCSDIPLDSTSGGISLTQKAIDSQFSALPGFGSTFVSIAIFFFAFTSIVANYYYGETNIRFLSKNSKCITAYRLCVGAIVFAGGVSALNMVWAFADITMAMMAICNVAAILILGKYAFSALKDYRNQLKGGIKSPVYTAKTNPDIADKTPCWPK